MKDKNGEEITEGTYCLRDIFGMRQVNHITCEGGRFFVSVIPHRDKADLREFYAKKLESLDDQGLRDYLSELEANAGWVREELGE